MTNEEFDPTFQAPSTAKATDEFDEVAARQAEEHRLQLLGDENEARGLNRDGSPKEAPLVEPPAPAAPAAPARPLNLQEVRELQIPNVKDAPLGGGGLTEDAALVKRKLAGEQRYPFFIPLDVGEKRGVAYRSVTINGYRSEIKKGMMVQVPESIYRVLVDAYDAEAQATQRNENLDVANPARNAALGLN